MKKQVVIIGAGPAGLTAAHELVNPGADDYEVTVLEETHEVGGISRTVRYKGNRMDIGGHRFFTKEERVSRWWEDRMPLQGSKAFDDFMLGRDCPVVTGGPNPESEDLVMLDRSRMSRIYYDHKFFDYPISLSTKTLRAMGVGSTCAVGASYLKAQVHRLDENSLENFYINRFGKKLYSMFFEGYTEKLWGRHPRDISADWGAQRVKGLSVRAVLKDAISKLAGKKDEATTETSLIERFHYPKYGPGQLWERAEEEIVAGGVVYLGTLA